MTFRRMTHTKKKWCKLHSSD